MFVVIPCSVSILTGIFYFKAPSTFPWKNAFVSADDCTLIMLFLTGTRDYIVPLSNVRKRKDCLCVTLISKRSLFAGHRCPAHMIHSGLLSVLSFVLLTNRSVTPLLFEIQGCSRVG